MYGCCILGRFENPSILDYAHMSPNHRTGSEFLIIGYRSEEHWAFFSRVFWVCTGIFMLMVLIEKFWPEKVYDIRFGEL